MTRAHATRAASLFLLDTLRGTSIRRALSEPSQSQWWSSALLVEQQMGRLRQLLEWAAVRVPFYHRFFRQSGFQPSTFREPADLLRLPVVTKEMMRAQPDVFMFAAGYPPLHLKWRKTGGSTGEPFRYAVSNDAFSALWAAMLRAWQWAGHEFGSPMVTIGGTSLTDSRTHRLSLWAYDCLRNNVSVDVGKLETADLGPIMRQVQEAGPDVTLYGYPSILYLLAQATSARMGGRGGDRRVITTSEMLLPGQRKAIELAFGAVVYDVYGCNEAGIVAGECDYHVGYHYSMENCLVEVLDESDNPALPGEVGRLVVTNFLNRAMCFIRYDTGDLGALSDEPCGCKRGLKRIIDLQGRSRDLIHAPGGLHIHGVLVNHLMYDYPWVDRYQIVQDTDNSLVLNLSISLPVSAQEMENLRVRLAAATTMEVRLAVNQPFMQTSGGKERLIVSMAQANDVQN